jgi:hypothetical protein
MYIVYEKCFSVTCLSLVMLRGDKALLPWMIVAFPKDGQGTRNASFLGASPDPQIFYFRSRLPRVLQAQGYSASTLALQNSFGIPLGIPMYTT